LPGDGVVRSRLFEDEIVLALKGDSYEPYFVDIGAGDGNTWSNSLLLAENGWGGVCFEINPVKLEVLLKTHTSRSNVSVRDVKVNAENVCGLLRESGCPANPAMLSIDIDGIDAYVLNAVLSGYRPQFLVLEYNHMVPPPIRMCVSYDPDWTWGRNHLFGASIEHLDDLVYQDYGLRHVHAGNGIWERGKPAFGSATQLWKAEHIPLCRLTGWSDSFTEPSCKAVYKDEASKLAYVKALFAEFGDKCKVSDDRL